MALELTEEEAGEISIDIGLISEMSSAQERVIRSIADALGMPDLRTFRAYLTEIDSTYYEMIRTLYSE